MTRKGKQVISRTSSFSSSSSTSSSPPSRHTSTPSTPLHFVSTSTIDHDLETAESIIKKWDPNLSSYAKITSLFYESRKEAIDFLKSVKDLQRAMRLLISEDSTSQKLIHAQHLMKSAMNRLQKEFHQILTANRGLLDPDFSVSDDSSLTTSRRSSTSDYEDGSLDDEIRVAGESFKEVERASSLAMADLKSIAECMIYAGYGQECVKIYKRIRKSIVLEGLYRLGIERLRSSQIQKMDWEVLEIKIKSWLAGSKIAVKTLFAAERNLCDQVFSSNAVKESCFSEICLESAMELFRFPESVAKCKKSPEKLFRILDIYDAIAELWPDIESIFTYESTSAVRSQALTSLIKLGDACRVMLTDFGTAIQKDSSKAAVLGGGIHPLTRYVMNYMSFLADYSGILADIVADWPLEIGSPLPEIFSDEDPSITQRIGWLILVLLSKLDRKAELYKDVPLSYLFLANNLQYIVGKVKNSNLRFLLGEEWVSKHESKVNQYAANYEKTAWSKVMSALPENPTAEVSPQVAKECFRKFNSAFEEAYWKQLPWVVPDGKLRDEIKISVAKKLVPAYRAFYGRYGILLREVRDFEGFLRFSPEDLGNYLSDLFFGNGISGSSGSSTSGSSGSSTPSQARALRLLASRCKSESL